MKRLLIAASLAVTMGLSTQVSAQPACLSTDDANARNAELGYRMAYTYKTKSGESYVMYVDDGGSWALFFVLGRETVCLEQTGYGFVSGSFGEPS